MTGAATEVYRGVMRVPGLIARARAALGARLWSWLGVGALAVVVGVAVVYGVRVEPSLLPRPPDSFAQRRRGGFCSGGLTCCRKPEKLSRVAFKRVF
jgi:hypothetical protein